MYRLVHRRARESLVVIPIDVEYRITVRRPLLLHATAVELPQAHGSIE